MVVSFWFPFMLKEHNSFLFGLCNYGRKIVTILIFVLERTFFLLLTLKIKGSMLTLLREKIMEDKNKWL